jgi:hypothetical protein
MSNPIAIKELFKAAFDDFVVPQPVSSQHSTIQNRAGIVLSLKSAGPCERVMTKGLSLLENEFGASGEPVFELEDKDTRVRLVGSGWRSLVNDQGTRLSTTAVGDYLEIIGYGTGLNLLVYQGSGTGDFRTTVDGGVESANQYVVNATTLDARGYGKNTVVNVSSGLTADVHHFKVRVGATSSNGLVVYGFELLNEAANITVSSGNAIVQGHSLRLPELTTSALKEGVVGTRGARVVKYLEDGLAKSVVTEVDSVSKYLSDTDHSNEEVLRRAHYREFGSNRSDDLSTISSSNTSRAFTLNDGTTTLVAKDATGSATWDTIEFMSAGSSGTPWETYITFVGTGLDILVHYRNIVTSVVTNLYVDGVLQGQIPKLSEEVTRMTKICSGLPYGTHVVRINCPNIAGQSPAHALSDIVIYQPKKPSIPEGSFELADYCVLADFVGNSTVSESSISTGVIRKDTSREVAISGAGWTIGVNTNRIGGKNLTTGTAGSYVEYTFVGEGADIRVDTSNSAGSMTFSVDGSSDLSSFTTSYYGAGTFTASTGVISGSILTNSGLIIRGLPFGLHKIRVTATTGATTVSAFDIITPIHINDPAFKVGNLSLKSASKFSPEKAQSNKGPDLSRAKAWLFYDAVNSKIRASQNIASVLPTTTGSIMVFFEKPFKSNNYAAITSASSFEAGTPLGTRYPDKVTIATANSSGTATNTDVYAVFYGELIDE